MKKLISKYLCYRCIPLFLSAILGIFFAKWLYQPICDWMTSCTCNPPINPLFLVLLALPTTTLLWYFRTHDTRENIHQNDLFDALKMLTDDKVVRREIATQRLINLVKKVPEYKKDVKFAFIKVLKSFPRKELNNNNWELEKRTYAQYILKWFNDNNYTAKKLNLNDCIFDFQEFMIEERKSDLFKLFTDTERQFKNISFKSADLSDANLSGAKYSQATKFPLSFQPENKGMKNIHLTQ